MAAETLRKAAALMRERASSATPGPWEIPNYGAQDIVGASDYNPFVATMYRHDRSPANTEHIASWHPVVALAVADWMDGVALHLEARADEEWFDLEGDPIAPEDTHAIGSALAVADAYLGGVA